MIDWTSVQEAMDRRAERADDLADWSRPELVDHVLELEERLETARELVDHVLELEERLEIARAKAWVAVPIAADQLMDGDLIERKDGALVRVLEVVRSGSAVVVTVEHGVTRKDFRVPADRPVPVLRRPTADALDILARQLGAQELKEEK